MFISLRLIFLVDIEFPKSPSREVPRSPAKSREVPRSPAKSREVPRSPAKSREVPRSPAKSREVPRSPAKSREVPRSPAKSREVPRIRGIKRQRTRRAGNFTLLEPGNWSAPSPSRCPSCRSVLVVPVRSGPWGDFSSLDVSVAGFNESFSFVMSKPVMFASARAAFLLFPFVRPNQN